MAKATKSKTKNGSNGAAKHEEPADLFDDEAGMPGESEPGDSTPVVTVTADELRDAAAKLAAPGGPLDAAALYTPTRKLKCFLSTAELAERASQVDANFEQIEEAEHELDAHARRVKSSKAKIDSLIEANREIARVRRDGYEYRDVACVEERDDRLGCMNTIRTDTREVIDTRALSAQERQGSLFDEATA
jgi:hypothetical protein